MRLFVILLLVLGMSSLAIASNQPDISNTATGIAGYLDTIALITIVNQLIAAVVSFAIAAFIYLKKLRGIKEKSTVWVIVALVVTVVGIGFLFGAILAVIIYLSAGSTITPV